MIFKNETISFLISPLPARFSASPVSLAVLLRWCLSHRQVLSGFHSTWGSLCDHTVLSNSFNDSPELTMHRPVVSQWSVVIESDVLLGSRGTSDM
jgi:hypothetical protein